MFSFLKKNTAQVVAPATGQLIPIDQVEDEVFSNK
ncbi:PTS glucose transporter subunit IIA, partial [Lacticaseibacillus paracasei]|nr:PTS glucose transporter subunit IIA [Lacticaseibacillus paracasei]